MPTLGSITKTIRIAPGDLELVESLMEDGTSWSGAIHKICDGYRGTPAIQTNHSANKELEEMANCMNMTYDELLSGVTELLLAGEITVSRGNVGIQIPLWAERFRDTCRDKGLEVEKVAESAIKAVEKGLL